MSPSETKKPKSGLTPEQKRERLAAYHRLEQLEMDFQCLTGRVLLDALENDWDRKKHEQTLMAEVVGWPSHYQRWAWRLAEVFVPESERVRPTERSTVATTIADAVPGVVRQLRLAAPSEVVPPPLE